MRTPPCVWLSLALASAAFANDPRVHSFERDDVLGTSFLLQVVGPDATQAAACERRALRAIERLRTVCSSWDAASELSLLNATPWEQRCATSPALAELLRAAARYQAASHGAFDPYLGDLHETWRKAAERGREPEPAVLAALRREAAAGAAFRVGADGSLSCTRPGRFDLDGIAKGFILDRALAAVVEGGEDVQGALLELGGDVRVWGSQRAGTRSPWTIEVADPRRSADNAPPLCRLELDGLAVASSGGYARPLSVGGRLLPQLLDPRSARPALGVLGATVVASDATAADALATALCVLPPAEGVACAERVGAECAIVDSAGELHTTLGWSALLCAEDPEPWAAGAEVEFTFQLVDSTQRRRFKRHYVAVWVEDQEGKRVKLLALWARRKELKYLKDLPTFWKEGWLGSGGENDTRVLRPRTRATRKPGTYTLTWDGTDEEGDPVPQGRYRIRIDVNREHGPGRERHTDATLELDCSGVAAEASVEDQPELKEVRARYAPAPKRRYF